MTEYFIYFNKIFYNFFSFLTEYLVNLLFIILVSFYQSTVRQAIIIVPPSIIQSYESIPFSGEPMVSHRATLPMDSLPFPRN